MRLSVIIFVFLSYSLQADVIQVAVGDWCPYVCNPEREQGRQGYIPELLQQVFEAHQHRIEFKVIPFGRAIQLARTGKIHAHSGLYRSDAPDLIFPSIPQGVSTNYFFLHKDRVWEYRDEASLLQLKDLGLMQDFTYEKEIEIFRRRHSNRIIFLSGDKPLLRYFQMMAKHRIYAIYEDRWVGNYYLKSLGLKQLIREAGSIGIKNQVFVAFSPKIPESKAYAKILADGINYLRQSGKLKVILDEYGMQDWVE
ncbi:substrate-binding periplasmic protein [Algicola sagamiensis]|uniref:substrate-binding periplasmic protein n=1 Tax=Algicola sagamiensis TaxID=163869 RepID=UPI0003640B3C|nr:transporter substrate-binding domain-containing protein [Algicola sagamiensis]